MIWKICIFLQLAFYQSALPFDIYKQTNWKFELSLFILIAGMQNHCMNIPLFIHFSGDGLLRWFLVFYPKSKPTINSFVLLCLCTHLEISPGNTPSPLLDRSDMCIFSLTKNHRSSQNGGSNCDSPWYWMRMLIFAHHCFANFYIFAFSLMTSCLITWACG